MNRRGLTLALLLGGTACAHGQPDFGYIRSRDPFYAALTTVRENLTGLDRYRGKPAQAARAMAQYEFAVAEIQDKPDLVHLPYGAQPKIAAGQAELRATLGVAEGAPSRDVAAALNRFAAEFDAGRRQEAMYALNQPYLTQGPQRTLDTLGNLPPMPAMEDAASSLALGPPGASEAVAHQRLHRRRLLQGSMSNWSR
jgi:hypothetical protein